MQEVRRPLRRLTESKGNSVHSLMSILTQSNQKKKFSYVIGAAKAAKVPGLQQRVVYVSVRLDL